jgi:hypothetical protein
MAPVTACNAPTNYIYHLIPADPTTGTTTARRPDKEATAHMKLHICSCKSTQSAFTIINDPHARE